jgi:single-stranded DNA-binding protein
VFSPGPEGPPWREDKNATEFTGRLEHDPEFYERDRESRCSMLIACIRTRLGDGELVKKTIHIEVRAGGRLAEHTCRHLRKGALVEVRGELDSRPAPSPDGTRGIALQVAARSIESCEPRQAARADGATGSAAG